MKWAKKPGIELLNIKSFLKHDTRITLLKDEYYTTKDVIKYLKTSFYNIFEYFNPINNSIGIYWKEWLHNMTLENRYYHNIYHIFNMLKDLSYISNVSALLSDNRLELLLAIFYHDYVISPILPNVQYTGNPIYAPVSDEQLSYYHLETIIRNSYIFDMNYINFHRLQNFFKVTENHQVINDSIYTYIGEKLMSDLDLMVLSSPTVDYIKYTDNIRKEYSHVDDNVFYARRLDFIKNLLKRENLYFTNYICAFENNRNAKLNLENEAIRIEKRLEIKGEI
jgi:predicted metal-dependent HD superfamily phosphohydrolase